MTPAIFHMPLNEMGIALGIGGICAVVYLYLLWRTVHLLPRVKHKGLFLFTSLVLRIFLLLAVMVLFAEKDAGRFLLIVVGFSLTRLFVLRFTRFGAYHREQDTRIRESLTGGHK